MSDERKKSKSSKSSKHVRKSKSERKSKATPKRMSRVVRQKMITKRAFLKFAKTQRGKVVESLTEEKRESIAVLPDDQARRLIAEMMREHFKQLEDWERKKWMDDAKTEVKEEIRQSRLIRKSTVQELAKKKKRRKKWREAAQETLVEKEVDKINEKEKAKTEVTKTSDSGDKNIEIDKESLVKISKKTVPTEPCNFWAWILIPVLLGTSLIPLLMTPEVTLSTNDAYTVARGSLNRFAAVEFCEQQNMRLPLPTSANDTISTMSEYWIRVENDGSQWVDSDTESAINFTNWDGDTSNDFGAVNTKTGNWLTYGFDHVTRTICI